MWKLVMYNSNHPNKSEIIIKSSCIDLLKYLQWNMYVAFKHFQYREKFQLEIISCESGAKLITDDNKIPESKL
jgi:hypothetical protein